MITTLVKNKKALMEYHVLKTYQAGVVLSGGEVKSLRRSSASLNGTFVKVIGGEVFLLNAQITPYSYSDNTDYDPKRTRKLLLKSKEIDELQAESDQKGATLIALSFDLVGRNIKLSIGLARGKKQHERRRELKERANERDIRREFKNKIRLT